MQGTHEMLNRWRVSIFLAVLVAVSFSMTRMAQAGQDPGFASGNRFNAVELDGEVHMSCNSSIGGMPMERVFFCHTQTLDPVEQDRFVAQVDADHLVLTATHEDGSTRTKDLSFDPAQGRSELVNLWIATLFQRPLLSTGTNRIHYRFTRSNAAVREGDLTVQVAQGETRHCSPQSYTSPIESDCDNQSFACQRYFEDQNYCQSR